jgi:coiled-coil domain-containing protein 130
MFNKLNHNFPQRHSTQICIHQFVYTSLIAFASALLFGSTVALKVFPMSSLAAVQADGYYYPPGWEPSQGSVSKAAGSRGANQYEQNGVIRFELPYNCWCDGCGRPLGKGTRFNARKEKAGKYHTTTIWAFAMRCPSCSTDMVIETDPANTDYKFCTGIRRREQVTA